MGLIVDCSKSESVFLTLIPTRVFRESISLNHLPRALRGWGVCSQKFVPGSTCHAPFGAGASVPGTAIPGNSSFRYQCRKLHFGEVCGAKEGSLLLSVGLFETPTLKKGEAPVEDFKVITRGLFSSYDYAT